MPDDETPQEVPYEEAAEQAVNEVQADAPESKVPQPTVPGDRLPNEDAMDRMMAEFKAMSEKIAALEAQVGDAQKSYAAATAALGPPPVAVYSRGIFDKLVSHRNANPDLPGHFDALIEKVRPLADAAAAVLDGSGKASDVTPLVGDVADAVDRFVTRTHRRRTSKALDFSAIESDLEYLRDAADAAAA